ncbi:hypothetical protein F441_20990 [Phytophthora nicotianae CJ01A1]|uniref:BZIP domain-containing protein n=1 Tax=Phytophthora nicotianae CJ01A1 TaxID=1317063 RepID=W2VU33_PHYNI|nr:hypothetical protein F441_20990 [Phytophthora nicotianae CJ01A1]
MLRHDRRPLTDSLIGPVQPRFQRGRHCSLGIDADYHPPDTKSPVFDCSLVNWSNPRVTGASGERKITKTPTTRCREPSTSRAPTNTHTVFVKKSTNYKTPAKRLERCRINQQRYRERQRAIRLNVKQLLKDIDSLERKKRDLSLRRESRSSCRVVIDIFKLAEAYILLSGCVSDGIYLTNNVAERQLVESLRNSFSLDVVVGDVIGVDELMIQLLRYFLYFDDPRIHLEQAVETTLGIVTATAILELTVSVSTLCSVFPQLLNAPRSQHDTQPLLAKRLLGKRLQCDVSLSFIFDEKSGRVSRLEISVDWVGALLVVLGNLKNVTTVLDGAVISG